MTRIERNRLKKRRKKYFSLLLFLWTGLLIAGLIITNNVMVKMTGLPDQKNLLSFKNFTENFQNIIEKAQTIPIKSYIKNVLNKTLKLLEDIAK